MIRIRPAALRAALLTGVLAPPLAVAQQSPADTLPAYHLEGLTVTVTGAPANRALLPQRIDVATTTDLERTPAADVADVLKKRAAVDVIQYPGLLSGVGIRGFRPEFSGINPRTLLLIDGRRAGTANLATFDLNSLERVEVFKGPAAALYGSSAMAGAINLVTRSTTGPLRGSASAAYGSFASTELTGRVGGSLTGRIDADLSGTWFSRGDDYRIGEDNVFRELVGSENATKLFADGRAEPVEELGDGQVRANTQYAYRSGAARVGYRLSDAFRADVRGETFQADDVETPGDIFFGTDQDGRKNLGRSTAEARVRGTAGIFSPLVRVYGASEETEYLDLSAATPFGDYITESSTFGAQLQSEVRLGEHSLTGGLDHNVVEADSRRFSAPGAPLAPYSPNSAVRSGAAFVNGRFSLLDSRLVATAGARADRVTLVLEETALRPDVTAGEEDFDALTGSFGLQYALGALRLHGTVGSAFVAPGALNKAGLARSVNSSGVASITFGNPDLQPERSVTYDAGIGIYRPRVGLDADATWFRTRVTDRISTVRAGFPAAGRPLLADGTAVGSVTSYVNASSAVMEGAEWSLGYDVGALRDFAYSLRFFAGATHMLRAEEIAPALTVNPQPFAGRSGFRPEDVLPAVSRGAETTSEIRNVADATVNFGVEYDDLRRFSSRLSGRYVGERLDMDFRDFSNVSDIRYPAFLVLDLVGTLRMAERYALSAELANLTDENYYEKRGYNMPGRSLRLRVSVDW